MLKTLKISTWSGMRYLSQPLNDLDGDTRVIKIESNGKITFTEKDFPADYFSYCKKLAVTKRFKVDEEIVENLLLRAVTIFADKIDEAAASQTNYCDALPDIIAMKYDDGTVKKGSLKKLNYEYDDVLEFYSIIEELLGVEFSFDYY